MDDNEKMLEKLDAKERGLLKHLLEKMEDRSAANTVFDTENPAPAEPAKPAEPVKNFKYWQAQRREKGARWYDRVGRKDMYREADKLGDKFWSE